MAIIFWTLVFGASYSHAIYPLLLRLIPSRLNDENEALGRLLPMSVIIAARNEEAGIAAKLEDTLGQDYASEKLEVIVVSDASDDATDAIVAGFHERNVRLLRTESRQGKEAAQALGISQSNGDIVVFTDTATRISPGSLQCIANRLSMPGIGAVSSEDNFSGGSGSGEGLYVRYEMALRRLESERAGLCGLSGSFFAAKREVCTPWSRDVPSDFFVALNCVKRGLKAISVAGVKGCYPDLKSKSDEFARKRRTILRGMSALARHTDILSVRRYGVYAFQLWSHKIMRWAVPYFLLGLAVLTPFIWRDSIVYSAAALGQIGFYLTAISAALIPPLREKRLPRLVYYFAQVNLAAAMAAIDFVRGKTIVTWEPSRR